MNSRFKTQLKTLENGLQICVVAFPGIKTVNLRCFVFTGSVYETCRNNGISHFIEHMMFRGNSKLGDARTLNLKMEEMGGEFNAVTSFDLTEFWLDYHIDYLDLGIRRFCQFLRYPLFEQIEVERSIILEEIRADYNENNQLIDLDGLVVRGLWPEQAMGFPVIGEVRTVESIKRPDLINWFNEYYQPGNMIIGITGDFEPVSIIEKITKELNHASVAGRKSYLPITPTPSNRKQIHLVYEKDNQFNLQWTFPTYPLTPELRVQYQLIQRIIDDGSSSRLQRFVREEKGLVYDISAEMLYFNSGATLCIQSQVGVIRLQELISVISSLVQDLIHKGITPEELILAKLRYEISIDCSNDTAQGILYETISPLIYPCLGTFQQVLSTVRSIKLEEINRTLTKLLQQRSICFVLVGPWQEEHKQFLESKLQPWIIH